MFAIDPARQNLYQNIAADYIKSLSMVTDFKVLPVGGDDALYIKLGDVRTGKELKEKDKATKSIDFSWKTGTHKFYASHKYTKEKGGSQDNQYKDIQNFLTHCRDSDEKNNVFVAICDGEYYWTKDSETAHKTKLDKLKRKVDEKTVFVTTINELSYLLERFVNKKSQQEIA